MITIDALYFLLLIELLAALAGIVAFLVVRGKKRGLIMQENKKALDGALAAKEDLQKQLAALRSGAAQPAKKEGAAAPAQSAKDADAFRMEITILEDKLQEKTKLLIELQAKYDGVEKEYLLLYQKHQAQEQPNT